MNWAWASSFDSIWRSPAFPMWVTMAAAGFFAIIVLITLVRAEKSVANGALTVITLLAVGIAAAATIRVYGGAGSRNAAGETRSVSAGAALPAMSCLDDLAGDTVLSACEKSLFASADSTAAAVAYTASQISRLTALGDADTAESTMTPELLALRRAVERDRYGLVAQVLQARDHCMSTQCAAFRSLTDAQQIMANMDQHAYDRLVARYAASWNVPTVAVAPAAGGPLAALGASVPTGRPTNADFPSAASTPAVSIMTPEPGTTSSASRSVSPPAAAANASLLSPRPTSASPAVTSTAAVKKPAKPARPVAASAPTPLAPPASAPTASEN
jgi:hypothetical protein